MDGNREHITKEGGYRYERSDQMDRMGNLAFSGVFNHLSEVESGSNH